MKIYLGADHRGQLLKDILKSHLTENGQDVIDVNPNTNPYDDYPLIAKKVALYVAQEKDAKGILLCGSGVGVDIVANKIDGVRSGLFAAPEQIKAARKDDDINVLALPADFITEEDAKNAISIFLNTPFEPKRRYQKRLHEISTIEDEN